MQKYFHTIYLDHFLDDIHYILDGSYCILFFRQEQKKTEERNCQQDYFQEIKQLSWLVLVAEKNFLILRFYKILEFQSKTDAVYSSKDARG